MARSTATVDRKGESGIALLVAVLILLLVSAIGIAAIEHSGRELGGAGRARTTIATFHAADGGVEIATNQLARTPLSTTPFSFSVNSDYTVRSGTRSDGTPQEIIPAGTGQPPEGYAITVGGAGYASSLYRTAVTSTGVGAAVELEVKLSRFEAGVGGY
jgi:hypothetical protein